MSQLRHVLDLSLQLALLKKRGAEFEKFFTEAAIELWGDDFEPWKPQGPYGDFKCDGYRISARTVFQCNAPEKFDAGTVAPKIERDFEGAREKFGERMSAWIFVHNQPETPALANHLVHQLRSKYPDIVIKVWTVTHLLKEIRTLSDAALRNLVPTALTFDQDLIAQGRAPTPSLMVASRATNMNQFDAAMNGLAEIDREVRRRLLGYCRWYDPASKTEVNDRILACGFEANTVAVNAQRLHDEKLIVVTEHHYLALAADICQQAADTLLDEFVAELAS